MVIMEEEMYKQIIHHIKAYYLGLLESYIKLIEHDGGQHQSAVLDDLRASMQYVVRKNKNENVKLVKWEGEPRNDY